MSKLEEAAKLALEDWVATLPDEIPEPVYSTQHIKKMNKLIDKMRGNRYHYFTTKTVKILIAAAIITALLMTAFVFPSSRDSITKTFGIDSLHRMSEGNNNSVNNKIEVGYIPDGFELVETNVSDKVVWSLYASKENKDFVVYKFASTNTTFFDTEQYNYEEVTHNGKEYKVYQNSNSDYGIIWTNYDYIYEINGTVSLDELFKVAESVK